MKLSKRLSFMLAYVLVLFPFIGFYLGGFYNLLTFFVIYTAVPLVDFLLVDPSNPNRNQEQKLRRDPYFKLLTWIYVPVQALFMVFAVYLVVNEPLNVWELLGFSISIGFLTGGIGITLAHELMHKKSKIDQFLSKMLLVMVCYGHFFIEHVRGHHIHVATPKDPASARLGESVYHFLPRTLFGSFKSSLAIENKRVQRLGYPVYHYKNQFWWIIAGPIILALTLSLYGGWRAMLFFVIQAVTAIFLLEVINYVEHYGLERKLLANGYYEKVSSQHSWNASYWLSNMLLFHLQRLFVSYPKKLSANRLHQAVF